MTDAPRAPPTRRLRLHTAATREALNWNLAATRAELGRLIAGGVMGPYRSVEVTGGRLRSTSCRYWCWRRQVRTMRGRVRAS